MNFPFWNKNLKLYIVGPSRLLLLLLIIIYMMLGLNPGPCACWTSYILSLDWVSLCWPDWSQTKFMGSIKGSSYLSLPSG